MFIKFYGMSFQDVEMLPVPTFNVLKAKIEEVNKTLNPEPRQKGRRR